MAESENKNKLMQVLSVGSANDLTLDLSLSSDQNTRAIG